MKDVGLRAVSAHSMFIPAPREETSPWKGEGSWVSVTDRRKNEGAVVQCVQCRLKSASWITKKQGAKENTHSSCSPPWHLVNNKASLLFTAGEPIGGCGQVCITEETRAMATQLPNRLHCHDNRSELAFSRVTHLQALPVLQSCAFRVIFSFVSSRGCLCLCLRFQLVPEKPQRLPERRICFHQFRPRCHAKQLMPMWQFARNRLCVTNMHVVPVLKTVHVFTTGLTPFLWFSVQKVLLD